MRYSVIKNGIQERINYLLGTNDTDPSEAISGYSGLTTWSIQANMIENIRRVVKGIVGSNITNGRIMRGLTISQDTHGRPKIVINSGIGFTPKGNIIVLNNPVTTDNINPGTIYYIYLLHGETGYSGYSGYHKSNLISSINQYNIIFDDTVTGAVSGISGDSIIKGQIQISSTILDMSSLDGVYLGNVLITENIGEILSYIFTINQGLDSEILTTGSVEAIGSVDANSLTADSGNTTIGANIITTTGYLSAGGCPFKVETYLHTITELDYINGYATITVADPSGKGEVPPTILSSIKDVSTGYLYDNITSSVASVSVLGTTAYVGFIKAIFNVGDIIRLTFIQFPNA
jgi:hypothetical protein